MTELPAKQIVDLRVSRRDILSYPVPLPAEKGTVSRFCNDRSTRELASYLRLEQTYLFLALLGLAVSWR